MNYSVLSLLALLLSREAPVNCQAVTQNDQNGQPLYKLPEGLDGI